LIDRTNQSIEDARKKKQSVIQKFLLIEALIPCQFGKKQRILQMDERDFKRECVSFLERENREKGLFFYFLQNELLESRIGYLYKMLVLS